MQRHNNSKRGHRHGGFTLIEIMVVVVIVALMSAISLLAIQQAGQRPFISQAEQLQSWLQHLAEKALLESTPYGVMEQGQELVTMVAYRQRWYPVSEPAAFELHRQAVLELPEPPEDTGQGGSRLDGSQRIPVLILADGYMEPAESFSLAYPEQRLGFSYTWDVEQSRIIMEQER